MQIHTAKQEAMQAIEQLPDNVKLADIIYNLYVIEKVQQGIQACEEGRTTPHEEVMAELMRKFA
jgi:predicted transcriptional regulator